MSLIQFDTQETFLIPDDKREDYFEWVVEMQEKCNLRNTNVNEAWNVYNDNIIIANREYFSQHNWKVIELFMKKIGAKKITENLIE